MKGNKHYYCTKCGEIIDETMLATMKDDDNKYDEYTCCPYCYNYDLEEAVRCEFCLEYFQEDEVEDGVCENCFNEIIMSNTERILSIFENNNLINELFEEMFDETDKLNMIKNSISKEFISEKNRNILKEFTREHIDVVKRSIV